MSAKILLVQEDPDWRNRLGLMLRNNGHQVVTAVNGLDALQAAENQEVDLILLDFKLSYMKGEEVLSLLRGYFQNKDIPILALSKTDNEDHNQQYLDAGADEWVKLSTTPKNLLEKIQRFLSI